VRKPLANAAGWLVPVIVALVATPWVLHALGAARFGVWALCLLIASLLPTLDLGYGIASVREIARAPDPAERRTIAREMLTVGLLSAAVFSLLALVAGTMVARWLSFDEAVSAGEADRLMTLLVPWIALACINAALTVLPRALEQFVALAWLGIASNVALWAGTSALASQNASLSALLLFGAFVQAAVAVALVLINRKLSGRWPLPVSRLSRLPRSSAFAWASFSNSLTSLATYHADKALVSAFLGPAAAGLYTIAANIANKLLGLIAALAAVVYPRVASLHGAGDGRATAHLYAVASRIALAVTLALATIGLVLAERFLRLWLGSVVTHELVGAFRLLIVAYVIASGAVVASNVLSGQGNARRGAFFAAAGGVITVLAGWLLIPRAGLIGAGIAALLGMSQAALFDIWVRRELKAEHPAAGSPWSRPWLGYALAVAAAGAATWACAQFIQGWVGLAVAASAGLATWLTVWFWGGFALPEEREIARRLMAAAGWQRPL
jgi:O-antigen/teichoic acid export membrane protein